MRAGRENRVGGIVLCGGRSHRMGTPKEWLEVDGENMLLRTVRVLSAVVSPVVVVARCGQSLPALPKQVILSYDERDEEGPAMGILCGLKQLSDPVRAAFVVGCDHPRLQESFVRWMVEHWSDSDDAMICQRDGQWLPMPGVYSVSMAPVIAAYLTKSQRSLRRMLADRNCTVVDVSTLLTIEPNLDSLINANDPATFESITSKRPKPM